MNTLGFSTMTFKDALLACETSLNTLFKWASEEKFGWIEIRDFDGRMSDGQIVAIRDQAMDYGLMPHLASDGVSLMADDFTAYRDSIRQAGLMGAGTFARSVIAPEWITPEQGHYAYSKEQFDRICKRVREAICVASDVGVTLVFENTIESIFAEDGYGVDALASEIPEMSLTLDTANSFNAATVGRVTTPADFSRFIAKHQEQIPYVHLKCSHNLNTIPTLVVDGDYPLPKAFAALPQETLWCVEVPADSTLESCQKRVLDGRDLVVSQLGRSS